LGQPNAQADHQAQEVFRENTKLSIGWWRLSLSLGNRAHIGMNQVEEKRGHLLAIHLSDDSSQLGSVRGRQLIYSVFQTLLADGSYLINGCLGCFSGTGYLQSRAPLGDGVLMLSGKQQ